MIDLTNNIVEIIIKAHKNLFSEEVQLHKQSMPPLHFKEEFAHLKIQLYRGAGHTATIRHFIWNYAHCVVFAPANRFFDNYSSEEGEKFDRLYSVEAFVENPGYVFSKEFNPDGPPVSICFIDMCMYLNTNKRERLEVLKPELLKSCELLVELQ